MASNLKRCFDSPAKVSPVPDQIDPGIRRKSFCWTTFLLTSLGIGIHKQSIAHWIFLVLNLLNNTAFFIKSIILFKPSLSFFNSLLGTVLQLTMFLILMFKRKRIKEFMDMVSSSLAHENKKTLRLLDVSCVLTFFAIFVVDAGYSCIFMEEQLVFELENFNLSDTARTITLVINGIVSVHSTYLSNWLLIISTLYASSFASIYYLQLEQLKNLKEFFSAGENVRLLAKLVEIDENKALFECCFSFIPFSSLIWNFTRIIMLLFILLDQRNDWETVEFKILATCQTVVVVAACALAIYTVSILQENIEDNCIKLCNSIRYRAINEDGRFNYQYLIDKIHETFDKNVTVWNICDVRRGLVFTVGSSFLTFAVLLMQVNNGSLGQLSKHDMGWLNYSSSLV